MLKTLAFTCFLTAGAAALFPGAPAVHAFSHDCSEVGAERAAVWPHPARTGLVAVLCRHDPLPGWWDSLWIVDTRPAAVSAAPRVLEVPLHGTGVVRFAWLDCPGPALAHVVDKTHMGTLTDRLLRFAPGGRIQVVERTRLASGERHTVHVRCP